MKIALFHNYYMQNGGEDTMFQLEMAALRARGHEVVCLTLKNADFFKKKSSIKQKIQIGLNAPFNKKSETNVYEFLSTHKPDIGHVHNWFPLFSPSIYAAHQKLGIPVVQTLHNYRLSCASANFQRNNKNCQECRPGHNLPAIRHRCYQNSLAGSLAWKRLVDRSWANGTFTKTVSQYIAPSKEVKQQHIAMGIPAEKIYYIPNACPDPTESMESTPISLDVTKHNICFIGRFTPEKGAHILIQAWKKLPQKYRNKAQLTLIGSGPEMETLSTLAEGEKSIEFTGQLPHAVALSTLRQADLLVCPSLWAEPFGLSVIEAMGACLPVISTALGGPSEIISDGIDGYLLPAGDIQALSEALKDALNTPEKMHAMGQRARDKYFRLYTAGSHAQQLTNCYESLL